MKKDWLEDIHDRMADFETDAPQGLWDDICSAEATAKETPVIVPQKKDYKIWIGSSAAVSACLLLFWFIRPDIEQVTEIPSLPTQEIASTDHRTPIEDKVLTEDSGQAKQTIIAAITSGKKSIKNMQKNVVENEEIITDGVDSGNVEVSNYTDSLKQSEVVKPSDSKKPSEAKKHSDPQKEESLKHYEYLAQTSHKRRNNAPLLSVSLSTSGGIGSDNRQLFQGGYVASSSTLSESDWVDSPLLGIMALNRGAETERKVTHHAPIRTGLSFSYRLNDRWSIESGISYAFASSDFHEGSVSNFIEEKQELHYVGIPLGATYRLLSWNRLDLYLSSNLMAEQCVSGQSRKKYIIGDKMQGEEETSAILSRPMQWSIGAKVGVQYNLNSLLSIYVEPGCSYYFDDHSSLETVFKDKVFDFNLNLGLRFSVGK